jgi:alkylation response protein AidB-like acyl-CoA dehydrogenase
MSKAANRELRFSDEQAMVLDSAREFCRDKSDISAVRALLDSDTGFDPAVWQELVALGWTGLAIDEDLGGSGLGIGTTVPIAECMGRYMLATPFFSTTLAAQAIQRGGGRKQVQRWLPRLAEGTIATVALLENEDWGDDRISCTAERSGDRLRLSGRKLYVTDAAVAELFVVLVNVDDSPAWVLVESGQLQADNIAANVLIDETKRTATVDFSGVEVAADAVLPPGYAAATLRDIRLLGALLTAAEQTGSTAACLDTVVDYLKTRKQFGKLIGSYQALKHPTVDMLVKLDDARSLLYHAATVVGDVDLDTDAEIACRMAKAMATDALVYAGDRAVQFHGGMGFTYECDAQLYIRRAQWSQQHYGDAYHHRKRLAPLLLDE